MKQLLQKEEWGIALLFGLVGLALVPAFWNGNPCGHDLDAHIYRIGQRYWNVVDGGPFNLWGEHMMRGYGYPIFPYYAPLTYWLGALLRMLGVNISLGLRVITWLGLVGAGWGGYRLGRLYFSSSAAWLVGLTYQFSPYMLHDGIERTAIPELLGLALLPWLLTAVEQALEQPHRRRTAAAGFWLGILFLAHNIVPLLAVIIILGLVGLRLLEQWRDSRPILPILRGGLGLLLIGFGVSLFFWLPAYVELADAQVRLVRPIMVDWPQYDQFYSPLSALAAWPPTPYDVALNNPPLLRGLAPITFLLAGVGMLGLFSRAASGRERRTIAYWGLVTLVSLFLTTALSDVVWRLLPLPAFVQLPFRFLGPASLGLGVLSGWTLTLCGRFFKHNQWIMSGLTLGLSFLIGISGFYWTYARECDIPVPLEPADIAASTQWNEAGRVSEWGGASSGETLPRWVKRLPPPERYTSAYQANEPVQRLTLPETAELLSWMSDAAGARFSVRLSQAAQVSYGAFYHPDWRVQVNGRAVDTIPTGEAALLAFTLPEGEHELTLRFVASPLRQLARIVSGTLLLATLLWAARKPQPAATPSRRLEGKEWRLLGASIGLILVGRVLVDQLDNPIRASRLVDGKLQGIGVETGINFSGEFRHLGYDGPRQVAPDQPVAVTQYWMAINEIGVEYGFGLRIVDDDGIVWSAEGDRPYGYRAFPGSGGWVQSEYVRDSWLLPLLPGTPPGTYWLEADGFRRDAPIALTPEQAVGTDPSRARLGALDVVGFSAVQQSDFSVTTVSEPLVKLTDNLSLRGWTVPEFPWKPGEQPLVDLVWEGAGLADLEADTALRLLDGEGQVVAERPFIPAWAQHVPPERSLLRDRLPWILPAGIPAGPLQVVLVVERQEFLLAEIMSEVPERRFDPPAPQIEIEAQIDFARLLGADLDGVEPRLVPGEPLNLQLYWQAEAETNRRYRVFVHLRDAEGNIVAQSDGEPAVWSRPTSSWLATEIVADPHTLQIPADLPAGSYMLVTGLYSPRNGPIGESVVIEFEVDSNP